MPLFTTILNSKPEPKNPDEKPKPTDGMSHHVKVLRKSKNGWVGIKEKSRNELVSCPCAYTERFSTRRAADAFVRRFPTEELGVFTVDPSKTVGKHAFTIRERSQTR